VCSAVYGAAGTNAAAAATRRAAFKHTVKAKFGWHYDEMKTVGSGGWVVVAIVGDLFAILFVCCACRTAAFACLVALSAVAFLLFLTDFTHEKQ